MAFTVGIAGTTTRTRLCAESLRREADFSISWVLTPSPREIGRKKILTKNPLHLWAEENNIHTHLLQTTIKNERDAIEALPPVDFLLVVDFGYLIPNWLLEAPRLAPINIHPSDLPKFRGSSPAQFVILSGETESAVCIMRLVAAMDAGPVITRLPFVVTPTMTTPEYYKKAFDLAAGELPHTLRQYAANPVEMEQPLDSPTPIARRLARDDGFLSLFALKTLPGENIVRARRALDPWPGVWTTLPHSEHAKNRENIRVKILKAHVENAKENAKSELVIDEIQYEGETPKKPTEEFIQQWRESTSDTSANHGWLYEWFSSFH